MKPFPILMLAAVASASLFSILAQDSVSIEGRVIATTTKTPIGAYTVKAYSTNGPGKPLNQTLTRADGTYSLPIALSLKTVTLRFEKLSYFSIPLEETVQLASPKTTVPDVVAVKYSDGQTVSTHDLLDAFLVRQESIDAITTDLPAVERENARKKLIKVDVESLKKTGVDSRTIMEVEKKFLPP
jgi:hypothetical protein